ncbi:ankyrin repeat domain-containing protein [Crenobacter sp. SG2305]|uniref:ankyrin repeat domain-containing protein n=1 Tax=Crenobacter oryzisoli TaxID=3056844 RepID=UPI0025AAC009|nr:ankyrin repeat domain-containing protein [Crenobacter sp. SG2305]MDN0083296.1 ankyrin repeat domain-containing protein [Crenobacter sp. SG2305]
MKAKVSVTRNSQGMTGHNKRQASVACQKKSTHGQLHKAAASGKVDLVRLYVKYGDDINEIDQNGMTPLHLAYQNGQTQVVEALLELNADQTIKDSNLHVAYDLIQEHSFFCKLRSQDHY